APKDPRFSVELAGTAYQQKDFRTAKERLRKALDLNPQDAYSREFLATIYFLDGNLEAALKYWNPEDKPRLGSVAFAPSLQLKESLRSRALAFNAPQILTGDALLATQSRLDNLGVFSNRRIELTPSESGNYDLTLHLAERNGWGDSKLQGIVSLLSSLPYATVYPEFYNLDRDAVNLTSLARWDSEKRRVSLTLSMPIYGDPSLRLRLYAVSRWLPRPRPRPAGSLQMDSGRSPRSADRFARIGFRAQRVTTMRCKRRFAQVPSQAKLLLMNYSNWASNATTTCGFAATPEH